VQAEDVLEFLRHNAYKPMAADELATALEVPATEQPAFLELLAAMESRGQVVRTRTKRYGAPERMNLTVGRLQGHPRGFGFVLPDQPELPDVYIGRENMGGAWNGDRVIARPVERKGQGRREGEIIRVLERANSHVVGTFHGAGAGGFLTPDDPRLPEDVFIPAAAQGAAQDEDTVVVEITSSPSGRRPAEGRVVERLGHHGDPGVDVLAVMARYHLSPEFPPDVVREAAGIPDEVEARDLKGRRDLRQEVIVTIDGEDAKDLDDAVSVEAIDLPDGGTGWRLGVHIADVSHYVREGTALDVEAAERGTSVYLVDRVIPMLPKRLSNGICSLNPQVDRLTLSCQMDVDARGRVVDYQLFPSVIRTKERMTYTDVTAILEGDEQAASRHRELVPVFQRMADLRRVLRRRREKRGSIDFDLPEEKIILDGQGRPVEIRPAQRGVADSIIEEFMILANETVAEHFSRLGTPFCYRVHEPPAEEKLEALQEFLATFGYRLKGSRNVYPKALQEVARQAEGTREERLVHTVMLRSMKQARYGVENLGHFGLAAPFYCHFTSPIRRYPDLLVHRVMRQVLLEGGISRALEERWQQVFPDLADHASVTERRADEAERETVDLKKAEFMLDKVGQEYDALISGVTAFGLFVALENGVEGLVHVSTMADDYYLYQETQYLLVGERTRRVFRLGDPVRVVVEGVDLEQRQVNFALAR